MNEHALMFRIASRFEDAEQMYEDIYKMIPAEQMKRESPALYVNTVIRACAENQIKKIL